MTRENRTAQCEGKVSFASYTQARAACSRRHGRTVYRCKHCRQWHVGTAEHSYDKRREQA